MRTVWTFGLGVLLGGGFYLLAIDTTSLPELYALAGVAALCAGLVLAREQGFVEAQLRPSWLPRAWRLIWRVPADIGALCYEALAQLIHPLPSRGAFRTAPFRATASTPPDTGRRALAEWLGSVTPNTVVIGVDDEKGLILVHQLRDRGDGEQLDLLRLG